MTAEHQTGDSSTARDHARNLTFANALPATYDDFGAVVLRSALTLEFAERLDRLVGHLDAIQLRRDVDVERALIDVEDQGADEGPRRWL